MSNTKNILVTEKLHFLENYPSGDCNITSTYWKYQYIVVDTAVYLSKYILFVRIYRGFLKVSTLCNDDLFLRMKFFGIEECF